MSILSTIGGICTICGQPNINHAGGLCPHGRPSAAPVDAGAVFGVIDPDYARIFTKARLLAWSYGYSCCVQGSFTRDLDLLMVPWADHATAASLGRIVAMLADSESLRINGEPSKRPHGRLSWTLLFPAFGDPRFVDVSAFPGAGAA
jgi:hypothetical protein